MLILLDTFVLREGGYVYLIKYQDCTGRTFTDWCHGLPNESSPKSFDGDYDAKCSFCWLGYPHTAAYHNDAIKVVEVQGRDTLYIEIIPREEDDAQSRLTSGVLSQPKGGTTA